MRNNLKLSCFLNSWSHLYAKSLEVVNVRLCKLLTIVDKNARNSRGKYMACLERVINGQKVTQKKVIDPNRHKNYAYFFPPEAFTLLRTFHYLLNRYDLVLCEHMWVGKLSWPCSSNLCSYIYKELPVIDKLCLHHHSQWLIDSVSCKVAMPASLLP